MQKFPGRTLEELDGMDWLRLQRALEVGRVVDLEARHALIVEGKLDGDRLTAAEWATVRRHNRLMEEWESAHGGTEDGKQQDEHARLPADEEQRGE